MGSWHLQRLETGAVIVMRNPPVLLIHLWSCWLLYLTWLCGLLGLGEASVRAPTAVVLESSAYLPPCALLVLNAAWCLQSAFRSIPAPPPLYRHTIIPASAITGHTLPVHMLLLCTDAGVCVCELFRKLPKVSRAGCDVWGVCVCVF